MNREGAVKKSRNVMRDISENRVPFRENGKFKVGDAALAREKGGQLSDIWSLVMP